MSFERIDISDRSEQEGRSCVILYNFGNKELKKIQKFLENFIIQKNLQIKYL